MAALDSQKTIVMIVAGLAAIVLVSVGIAYMLSSGPAVTPITTDEGLAPDTGTGGFNLNVLQRAGYKALDQRPIQDGSLPVKPPATTGKANPFL